MESLDPTDEFMASPLVTWVRTFEGDGGHSLSYPALADGVFLYDVMEQIADTDSDCCLRTINRQPKTASDRLSNLYQVLQKILAFYQTSSSQLVLSSLPDLVLLSKSPAVEELQKLLLLLLGCAVQGHHKDQVVTAITTKLDLTTQTALMLHIQEISHNPQSVWVPEWSSLEGVPVEWRDEAYGLLVKHCHRLAGERDNYCLEWLKTGLTESDSPHPQPSPPGDTLPSPTDGGDSATHLSLQLAELKAKMRRLRQDHDEKCENVAEFKEEIEHNKVTISKLRQENVELTQDARSARAWRDEADILREKAVKVDTLELEVTKYKDKILEMSYFKTRMEELREDNKMLSETKDMLEEQLDSSRKRSELTLELESKLIALKKELNDLHLERSYDKERIDQLLEDNAHLQMSAKNSLNESSTLVAQIDRLRHSNSNGTNNSFSDDINSDAQTRLLKLKLENQRLEAELEKIKLESANQSSEKILELEKENKRLSLKVQQLQESERRDREQLMSVQQSNDSRKQEVITLKDTIVTVRDNAERQCKEMQEENSHLQDLLESLRIRQSKSNDARLVDVETQNRKLMDTNIQLQSQVSRLDYEKQQLQRLTDRLRESADRLHEVESQKMQIENENKAIKQNIAILKESSERHEKLERDHASLEVEYTRVSRKLQNTIQILSDLESVQNDKAQLQAEVERLTRKLDSLKLSSVKLADLEGEKDSLSLQTNKLQQQINTLQKENGKVQQLEVDLATAGNESQRLKRSLDVLQRKVEGVEKEKTDLENENSKLNRSVETLRLSDKKLNDMEKDLLELESKNDLVERENRSLQKEISRLKDTLEVKDNSADEWCTKAASLQRMNQKLTQQVEALSASDNQVRELCADKRQLEQQVQTERKTLSALREDLVSEKVKTQQLTNQLESLTVDLQKLGLNPQELSHPDQKDFGLDSRFNQIEMMIEETLKRSQEVKDEKIASLEARLNESVSRNTNLKQQLMKVRSDYESLLQRQQEESDVHMVDRELLSLKMILERTTEEKSSLETEITSLTSQAGSYREQVCALQSQVTSLAQQNTVMSKHNAQLQGDHARLQVENTTLQSQSASLIAQNTAMQNTSALHDRDLQKAKRNYESQGSRLSQLSEDHSSLQKLHEQLQRDYETLSTDLSTVKNQNKEVRQENKILREQQSSLTANEEELLVMRKKLDDEMTRLKTDSVSLSNLRTEHSKLKDDFRCLFTKSEKCRSEYMNLQSDYKAVRTENHSLKLRSTELNGQLNNTQDQIAAMDVEVAKITNKCQVLQDANSRLDEERKSLLSQVHQLIGQYHELLTHTMEDKNLHHQEEKHLADKLNNLQRQKEKLEEKIMEQYRRMDNPCKNKRGFGSNLVRRVRKAGTDLINKTGRSRSRGRREGEDEGVEECSPDSSSLSSNVNESSSLDSLTETRRDSMETLSRPSRKSLPPSISELYLNQSMRGSVSSEEVASSLRSSEISETLRDEEYSSLGYLTSGAPSLTTYGNSSSPFPSNGVNNSPFPSNSSHMNGANSSPFLSNGANNSPFPSNGVHNSPFPSNSSPFPSNSSHINGANSNSSPTNHNAASPMLPSNGHPLQRSSTTRASSPRAPLGSSSGSHSRDSSISSTLELCRAGSRKPLCISDEMERETVSNRATGRGKPNSSMSNAGSRSTTPGLSQTSTPKSNPEALSDVGQVPGTPKLPPRQLNISGPLIPPRCRRDVNSSPLPLDHRGAPPPPPPKPNKSNLHSPTTTTQTPQSPDSGGSETASMKERRVANSIWYEYGCV